MAKESIKLTIEVELVPCQVKMNFKFMVFDTPSPYAAVMRQPSIFSLRVAVSLYHHSIKFSKPHGIGKVKGNKKFHQCTLI